MYEARTDKQGWKTSDLSVPVELVDNAVTYVVHNLLYQYSEGQQDRARAYLNALQEDTSDQAKDISEAIATVETGIKEWELARKSAMKQLYEPGVDEATKQLKRLYPHEDRAKVMAALPTRTWESIMIQAGVKKIVRDTWLNTGDIPKGLTYADVALLRTLGHEYPYKVKNLPYLHMHRSCAMIPYDSTLMLTGCRNLYEQ